jgi:hypothetical protein
LRSLKVVIKTALASFGPALDFDSNGVPWLLWSGTNDQRSLNSMTSESSDPSGFTDQKARVRTFRDDFSLSGPAFRRFKGLDSYGMVRRR